MHRILKVYRTRANPSQGTVAHRYEVVVFKVASRITWDLHRDGHMFTIDQKPGTEREIVGYITMERHQQQRLISLIVDAIRLAQVARD